MPIEVLKCPTGCGGEMFRWTPPNDAATEGGWRLQQDFSRIDTRFLFPQSMMVLQTSAD